MKLVNRTKVLKQAPHRRAYDRNQTSTGRQVKEVRISNGSLWNCLAIHYATPSQVVTSFEVLSKNERHRMLLAFFLEHADGTHVGSRRDFTCRSCGTQGSLEKRCIRFSCPMDCKYRIFCFECAWKYTRAIQHGAGLVVASNRGSAVSLGNIKFRCENCNERGRYERFDNCKLDYVGDSFLSENSRRWIAVLEVEINTAANT